MISRIDQLTVILVYGIWNRYKKFLELEFVLGYNESWPERAVGSNNYYLGTGMKGTMFSNYLLACFENDSEDCFEYVGKLVDSNDRLNEYVDERGNEIWESYKFPMIL